MLCVLLICLCVMLCVVACDFKASTLCKLEASKAVYLYLSLCCLSSSQTSAAVASAQFILGLLALRLLCTICFLCLPLKCYFVFVVLLICYNCPGCSHL